MKKNQLSYNLPLIIVTLVLLFSALFLISTLQSAFALGCTMPAKDYGTATYTFTSPSDQNGPFRIWVRMAKTTDNNDSILVDYDGTNCFKVGDNNSLPQTWNNNSSNWIDYHEGASANKNTINLVPGNHTIKMIGVEPGVKVDRILLIAANSACIPEGVGDNCVSATNSEPRVTIISPANNSQLGSSAAKIKATVVDDDNNLQDVTFKYGETVLRTFEPSADGLYEYQWNTLNLPLGNYTISVIAKDSQTSKTQTVNVSIIDKGRVDISGIVNNDTWIGARSIKASTLGLYDVQKVQFSITKPNGQVQTIDDGSNPYCLSNQNSGDACIAYDSLRNGWEDGIYSIKAIVTYRRNNEIQTKESVPVQFVLANTTNVNMPPTNPGEITVSDVTKNSLILTWVESSDDGFVKEYRIYKNGDEVNPVGTTIGSSATVPAANTTVINDLECGTSYTFKVRAFDNGDPQLQSNDFSEPKTVTTANCDDTQKPTTPTNLKVSDIGTNSLKISWDASTDNSGIKKYIILRQNPVGSTTQLIPNPSTAVNYEDLGLLPNNKYTYSVIAEDAAGNRSDASNSVEATTSDIICQDTTAPKKPNGFRVSERRSNGFVFEWNKAEDDENCASGIAKYRLYIVGDDGELVKEFSSSASSGALNTLLQRMDYEFYLTAVDAKNNESEKAPSTQAGLKMKTLSFGDADGNEQVDISDLAELLKRWYVRPERYDEKYDYDGDSVIGILDLANLLRNWTR